MRTRTSIFVVAILLAGGVTRHALGQVAPPDSGAGDLLLLEARRLFDALDYERALPVLDQAIAALQSQSSQGPMAPEARAALASALELRARARFGLGDQNGARSDFKSLLIVSPGHALWGQVSPRVAALFEEIRSATVGSVRLRVTPSDADVELDGMRLAVGIDPLPLVAGEHTLSATRAGYRPIIQPLSVTAGATADVTLALERVSSIISIVTVPPAVEVIVDGVPRGATEVGRLPDEYAEWPGKLGVAPASFSRPLVVADLAVGAHRLEFRRDCYVSANRLLHIEQPDDYRVDPVKLDPAVGELRVETETSGAIVYLDGAPRGTAPLVLPDVCEGPHVVELRAPHGRDVHRVDVRTGDKRRIEGALRPAFAILPAAGPAEGARAGPDDRLIVERALAPARGVTFFAPAVEPLVPLLRAENLPQDWLAFDRAKRPVEGAGRLTTSARAEISTRLARAIEAQGFAQVAPPRAGDRTILLTLLAAGSGEPDVIEVRPDEAESRARVIAQLDYSPPLLRPSAGLVAIDVLDVPGAVIVKVEPDSAAARAGLAPGDAIVRVNGQAVSDALSFGRLLADHNVNDRLPVEVHDRSGQVKQAELAVVMVPRAIAMADQTLLFNKLILDFRHQLAVGRTEPEQSVVRLNLGIALMRAGNWPEARAELAQVQLPPTPGVSGGTVQYLLGLCHEALGELAEAEQAWRAALASPESLLTEDGPSVKELAEQKLADLARLRRR